jgi:hypothetical protein
MNQAEAEFELEEELNRLMTVLERSDLASEAEMFGTAGTAPVFDLACTGCAGGQCVPCASGLCVACPIHGGACRAVVLDAILEAIKLANNAANQVDAAVALPRETRGKAEKETARLYQFFFCHDPAKFIPWAGGPSGATVSTRLRAVARELGGGRRLLFECRPDGGCNAFTMPGVHSTVFLCPPFWTNQGLAGLPEVDRRAGTILHEMLHNLYDVDDATRFNNAAQPTPRRFDAHCYEAFVLRANGFGADPTDVQQCGQAHCEVV